MNTENEIKRQCSDAERKQGEVFYFKKRIESILSAAIDKHKCPKIYSNQTIYYESYLQARENIEKALDAAVEGIFSDSVSVMYRKEFIERFPYDDEPVALSVMHQLHCPRGTIIQLNNDNSILLNEKKHMKQWYGHKASI